MPPYPPHRQRHAAARWRCPTYRTLLDCLRYDLGLTGTKEGCGVGVCGACTVLLDGKMISACIALAVFADGRAVTTIEGLAEDERLHPVQQAFIRHRRLSVRHLHARPDHGGQGAPRRDAEPERRRDPASGCSATSAAARATTRSSSRSARPRRGPAVNAFDFRAPRTPRRGARHPWRARRRREGRSRAAPRW